MTLDADTALEPLTPTRWRGEISDRWRVVHGPFGGYVAAFLTRALVAAVDDPARATWRDGEPEWAEPAPEAPPPEACERLQRVDHLALTALSDGWMPAAFSRLGRPVGAPTVDLTIHFRAPLAPGEWVLADYRSRFSAGGAWEEEGELWAADGTLLAQSRQLALIRA